MTPPKTFSPERAAALLQSRGIAASVVEEQARMVCRIKHPLNGRDYAIRSFEDLAAITTELERAPAPFEWKQAA